MENVPPSENALYQHTLRAVFQEVHVWGQLTTQQNLPSPQEFGWKRKGDIQCVRKVWKPGNKIVTKQFQEKCSDRSILFFFFTYFRNNFVFLSLFVFEL